MTKKNNELISQDANLAYPIKDGIPIMLKEKARNISVNKFFPECFLKFIKNF